MPNTVPTKNHFIDHTLLREFSIDGQLWFPIVDVVRLLETSRNSTQLARTLPPDQVRRVKLTDRPPTHMISGEGLMELLNKSARAQDKNTRAGIFKEWYLDNVGGDNMKRDALLREIAVLQGEIEIKSSRLRDDNERLDKLTKMLDALRANIT